MRDPTAESSRHLQSHGLRSTRSGRTLLQALQRRQPATAKTLHRAIASCGCDLATVHRLLTRFERAGLVRASHLHGKSRWYELVEKGTHYHHLVCTRCKRIQRLQYCAVETLEKSAFKENGFRVRAHSVELFGLCRECDGVRVHGRNKGELS